MTDPDDRRKHLDFIQAVVTRMSAASSAAKGWLLPVVTASYGYALVESATVVAWLGVGSVLLFGFLDANYLRQEKAYRRLYDAVASGTKPVPEFSLDPSHAFDDPDPGESKGWWVIETIGKWVPGPTVLMSWSVGPFYGVLVIVGVAIAFITC